LREELGDVHRHYLILEAIALGRHRVSEIAGFAGIEAKDMPEYLRTLISLELVRREVRPERSKKARYYLNDSFFAFWFRFVKLNRYLKTPRYWSQTRNTGACKFSTQYKSTFRLRRICF